MAKSEVGHALHLSQALHALVTPAARALDEVTWEDSRRGDDIWVYGVFLEAAGWLCLGSDLGYFPRRETAEVLASVFAMEAVRTVPEEARELVVGNDWAELLAVGDVDQALEVRLFRNERDEALAPAFQTAWSFAAGLADSRPANAFQKALLVLDDNRWGDDIRSAKELLDRAVRSGSCEDAVWQQLEKQEHLLDGLIITLHHLEILATWAYSTAEAGSGGEMLARDERVGAPAESPARRLVLAAGKLLHWRLDLAHQQVQRRLDEAIDLADNLLPDVMFVLDFDIEEAWPKGFRAAMKNALAHWRDITGGASTRGRPGSPSSSGSGGDAVGMADAGVTVEVEAGVSSY